MSAGRYVDAICPRCISPLEYGRALVTMVPLLLLKLLLEILPTDIN